MKRSPVAFAIAAFLVLAACKRGPVTWEGNYHSTWGACVILEAQEDIAITYARGSMRCVRRDEVLDCNWASASAKGRAKFTRHPDRSLVGTWGRDGSDQDGGAWILLPE